MCRQIKKIMFITCFRCYTIHVGVGNTGLNKILACANLPRVNDHIYKKYESIIEKAIDTEDRDNCKRAASEEKELVIKNVNSCVIHCIKYS